MYLIFTHVIREVVNKKRFLSHVVLFSFNIIRNTLYDLIFYKKNTNTRRITWNQNYVQQIHTFCQDALSWRRWVMLYDINTFVQSIKWDLKTTHWHFRSFVSFYNNKKGLKFTDLELLMIFFKKLCFLLFLINSVFTMLFPLVGSTKESKGKKANLFLFLCCQIFVQWKDLFEFYLFIWYVGCTIMGQSNHTTET